VKIDKAIDAKMVSLWFSADPLEAIIVSCSVLDDMRGACIPQCAIGLVAVRYSCREMNGLK
jgi:hypothetical protein